MLGCYVNFPENIHKAETFSTSLSNKKLQQMFIEALFVLNKASLRIEDVAGPSVPACKVAFEIGVAEGSDFNFLDAEEKDRLMKALNKTTFQLLDFLIVVRYGSMEEQKRKLRMKFDYFMLRMLFGENSAEAQVFHEKGLRHTSPEDLLNLVVKRVNAACSKQALKPREDV